MKYECKTHGEWDANRASGCPDCVREMRSQISDLKKEVLSKSNDIELLKSLLRDIKKWDVGQNITIPSHFRKRIQAAIEAK